MLIGNPNFARLVVQTHTIPLTAIRSKTMEQQGDRPVLSLRPGGGGRGGSRLFAHRPSSSSSSSDFTNGGDAPSFAVRVLLHSVSRHYSAF